MQPYPPTADHAYAIERQSSGRWMIVYAAGAILNFATEADARQHAEDFKWKWTARDHVVAGALIGGSDRLWPIWPKAAQ